MAKQIIAVDIDDVLAANAEAMVSFSNEQWGTHLTIEGYQEHWGKMWQIEHEIEETEKRAHAFFDSGAFARLRHFPEALPVLKKMSKKYRLILLTSRRQRLLAETTEWVNHFFPGLFEATHYSGFFDTTKPGRHSATKRELCVELGVGYLIDDQLKHCEAVAQEGVKGLLFGDYAWNRTANLPSGVVRVRNWQAVGEFFDAQG